MKNNDFGILSMELYWPKFYIDQNNIENTFNYSKGKITVGLGQNKMSVPAINEDSVSMGLTVLKKWIDKENIKENNIGRLEFATESIVDKAKSAKTIWMDLFPNNKDIEGITTINACYGGTAAIFNSLAWLESKSWDGRLAIVIMSDVALYKENNTIPTGGAGSIALLLGPNAPITFEVPRASYFENNYDFYKPNLSSEYPVVNGGISIDCYYRSLINCYDLLKKKFANNSELIDLNSFDSFLFHCPFAKQVEKSFLKICYFELLNGNYLDKNNYDEKKYLMREKPDFKDKNTINKLKQIFVRELNNKVYPNLILSKEVGNIYTGSLYLCLISYFLNNQYKNGQRILLFSYGSGSASSIFILNIKKKLNLDYIPKYLNERTEIDFEKYSKIREDRIFLNSPLNFGKSLPVLDKIKSYHNNTYVLKEIDNKGKRIYTITNSQDLKNTNKQVKNNKLFKHLTSNISLERKELLDSNIYNYDNYLFNKFYKKNLDERIDILKKYNKNIDKEYLKNGGLTLEHANFMIENCIGKLSLPMGLATNFKINNKFYNIPMVIEEPSVIAGASAIGKFIAENGGFKSTSSKSYVTGQIQIIDSPFYDNLNQIMDNYRQILINKANEFCVSMKNRGGGVIDMNIKKIDIDEKYKSYGSNFKNMCVVEIIVDTCESMGANTVNTVLENLSPNITNIFGGNIRVRILSNSSPKRLAISKFKIPIKNMDYKNLNGKELSTKIIEAFIFADNDVFRASTHNKGIMNGIDAVALALGQDWRAIEAGIHSYFASINKKYGSLTEYWISKIDGIEYFEGKIEIPWMIGVKGGALGSNLTYKYTLGMLGNPDTRELMTIMASLGLAQNFAALRALVSDGIQKGHMKLQGRNLAIRAGIPLDYINDCVNYMQEKNSFNLNTAKEFFLKFN